MRRGLDGPEIDVCGSHKNWWERSNAESLRREDTELRREAGTILAVKLALALKEKAGIEVVRQIGVQPSAHSPALVLSYVGHPELDRGTAMTTATKSKPARLADEIEALGWVVERVKVPVEPGEAPCRLVRATRGAEVVEFTFWRLDSGFDKLHEARAYDGEQWRYFVNVAGELRRMAEPPIVPFALDAPDEVVLAAVAGKSVEWTSRITGKVASGAVPRGGMHLRLVSGDSARGAIAPEDRVLHFTDPHGFHAVRLGSIVRVV